MKIDEKIISELKRHNQINTYIVEQDATDPLAAPTGTEETPADDTAADLSADEVPEPVDVAADPDVDVVDNSAESVEDTGTEELDITDLVSTQKKVSEKQDEYMDVMISKLEDLENKLSAMDSIFDKINSLETKIEKYRTKTPEEKLHLRSLDSYPFNQKLTDFFVDKQDDMDKTGKNEYVLTDEDVENFSPNEIKGTFNSYLQNKNQNQFK
jgi:hypothetical protein